MKFLLCPNCREALVRYDGYYGCENNHRFDRAKSGYANLLLPNQKNATDPGDTKEMCRSRERFLSKGYYDNLKNTICNIAEKYAILANFDITDSIDMLKITESIVEHTTRSVNSVNILDGGCGEGHYTNSIYDTLNNRCRDISTVGVDISKHAVSLASRKNGAIDYVVGSVFHLPVASSSCDVMLNLFAPFCREEIVRVLKQSGILVMAIPDRRHLYSLKEYLYDTPYENEVKHFAIEGLTLLESVKVAFPIRLESNADIKDLFSMTPYLWRTKPEDVKRLDELDRLETTGEFIVLVYRLA